MSSTVSAISTPLAPSGVAIIRISGEKAITIAEKMFNSKIAVSDFEPYKLYTGSILAGDITDFGMCVIFKAPKSYTGENMAEFHCHGGVSIARAVFKQTLYLGCEPAGKGEFTKRAFLNGKLSLSSCEGLIDMINGESLAQAKAGLYLYREKLLKKIIDLQQKLTYLLALIDANIDYPEEDIKSAEIEEISNTLIDVKKQIEGLTTVYGTSKKLVNGVKVAICGKPNSGKSSLLNALIGLEKAIVAPIAGTTRDVVEGSIEIKGVRFDFFDTAGIRESLDAVEKIGVEHSYKTVEASDFVLYVVDSDVGFDNEDAQILSEIKNQEKILVFNKSDLNNNKDKALSSVKADITVSALEGQNIEKLKSLLFKKTGLSSVDLNADFLTEERHFNALKKACVSLDEAIKNLKIMPLDVIAVDILDAWKTLGLISGETADEAVIDEIFAKFCVGK